MHAAALWILSGLALGQTSPTCEDAYYVVVFGAQRPVLKAPRYSHSFATFVRVTPDGGVETATISWLPVTGMVRPLSPRPEPGRNFSLEETLQLCAANRMEVAAWGPYQIEPSLWEAALVQKARLDSGAVLYKAYDNGSPDGSVSNCIHAVAFMAREPGQTRPYVVVAPANWGESGSYWVALTLRPWYVEPCRTHPCLMTRLGLDPDAFIHYDLARNPTRAPVTRVVQATLQAELLPNRVRCR